MFYIGLYKKTMKKIFISEPARLIALVFGMYMLHNLVDLYQVCSNYVPVDKNGPVLGVTCFTQTYREA